jgi:hypothetical protein
MHEEALTKESARVFPQLSRLKGMYLAGGTALALQIGHRLSIDFDFFSQESLPSNPLAKVKRVFENSSIEVAYRAPDQLNVFIDGVKLTLFHYPYPVIDDFVVWHNVSLASIREIAAMKAFSIGKRLSYKDYIDWYFLLKEKHADLSDVIDHAKKKFGADFNDRLFLGQLVTFEDITPQKIDFLRDEIKWDATQNFLREAVRDFKL